MRRVKSPRTTHPSRLAAALAAVVGCLTACTVEDEGFEPDAEDAQEIEDEEPTLTISANEDDTDAEADEAEPLPDGPHRNLELGRLTPGELVEVEDGIVLPVPDPGELIAIDVVYDDGTSTLVGLETDLDGDVRIDYPDDFMLELPPGTSAACQSACSDTSFAFTFSNEAHWSDTYRWRYRHTNSPVGKTAAINALKNGINGIVNSRNSCSMADTVSATALYQGETTKFPAPVLSNGNISCNSSRLQDGVNSIGWGLVGSNRLAVTCVRALSGSVEPVIVAADMKFNKNKNWYTGNQKPSNCSNRFSLRSVATHEAGHAYGLGHTGCAQTMAPTLAACNGSVRTLGRGDVLGLRKLY